MSTQVNIRMDDKTKEKLDRLCEVTYRNQSDLVRMLIDKEFAEITDSDWHDETITDDEILRSGDRGL